MQEEGTAEPDPVLGQADATPNLDGLQAVDKAGDEPPAADGWHDAALNRFGIAGSVLIHLCLVLWIIGWPAAAEKSAEQDVISVTLVPEKEVAEPPPAPPEKSPAPAEEEKPPAAQETASPENAAPVADPPEAPKPPDGTPPPPAQAAPAPTPSSQAESAPPPPPQSQSESQSSQSQAQSAPATQPQWSDVLASLGMAQGGRPTTLSQDQLDAVRAQAKRCWEIPPGWTEPRQATVTIRFQLHRDGTLRGRPSVVSFPASEIGKTAALNAIRAVADCAPFNLPPEKYAEWKDIQLRFEP